MDEVKPDKPIVGLLVNPVAGMGGSVGLKGTDGKMHRRAIDMGAQPVAPGRADEFNQLPDAHGLEWLAAPGPMGADSLGRIGLACKVIGTIGDASTPGDTRRIALEMAAAGAQLIVFVGGDGTARDMVDALGSALPVVAVPAGVKVYSAAFAVSPRAAAQMLDAWLHGAEVGEEDVLDIDEDAFRSGRLDSRLYGALRVPQVAALIQGGKEASGGVSEQEAKQAVGSYLAETMDPDMLYLLGPGTTVKAVAEALGLAKTLLGVDAVLDGQLVGTDLNERGIDELLADHPAATIVVTPLGGNGFILGRGNKQFTPAVIRRVGVGGITVICTPSKLAKLPHLRVDTGDSSLDAELAGYRSVLVGYRYSKMIRVEC